MHYPPTSPEGGPSFASEFDILEGIACNVQAMNVAAGGESYPINATSFFGLLQSIDCNLCRAVTALGGADCVGGFDGEMGLLMSIACNSRSLVDAVSGVQAGSGYEYNTVILWNQINCNFMAGATATGTSAPGGYSGDSVWNLLQSIYCATAQIVDNGFAPPDPVQAFINSLLPFSPDLLIIADTYTGGASVASAPDSSGNNNPMEQATGAKQPTLSTGPNGKAAYSFDGGDYLQCPLDGLTTMASVTVFSRTGVNNNSNRIATLLSGIDQGDANNITPINQYLNNDVLSSYYNGGAQVVAGAIADTNFHYSISYLDGVNGNLTLDGATATPSASSQDANAGTYAAIGGNGTGSCLLGKIAFHARWATAPSGANLTAFTALVKAYYGL